MPGHGVGITQARARKSIYVSITVSAMSFPVGKTLEASRYLAKCDDLCAGALSI